MRRPADLTISELRKALQEKESFLSKLEERKSSLQSDLEAVDRDIALLLRGAPKKRRKRRARRRVAKVTVKAAAPKKARRRRRGRGITLREAIHSVLTQAKEAMSIPDIGQAALKIGYKTKSKNMRNLVSQAIYTDKQITRSAPGRFRLKNGKRG